MASEAASPGEAAPHDGLNASPVPQGVALVLLTALGAYAVVTLDGAGLLPRWLSILVSGAGEDGAGAPRWIVVLQLGGFVAFLVLCAAQAAVAATERAIVRGGASARQPQLFRAAGLPASWSHILATGAPGLPRPDLEVVLGQHEEARLSLLRITLAAFPTSGFIGTVLGIRQAIGPLRGLVDEGASADDFATSLGGVIGGLELAFDTTLVGLVLLLVGSFVLGAVTLLVRASHAAALARC